MIDPVELGNQIWRESGSERSAQFARLRQQYPHVEQMCAAIRAGQDTISFEWASLPTRLKLSTRGRTGSEYFGVDAIEFDLDGFVFRLNIRSVVGRHLGRDFDPSWDPSFYDIPDETQVKLALLSAQ